MNLILLSSQVTAEGSITLDERQSRHVREILKSDEGAILRVGLDNIWVGTAKLVGPEGQVGPEDPVSTGPSGPIIENSKKRPRKCPLIRVKLIHSCSRPPPERRHRIDLLLALPRPRIFDNLLQTVATLGVGKVIFCSPTRSEIAYLSSSKLQISGIEESLRLGLEQANADPFFPHVYLYASWQRCISQLVEKHITPEHSLIVLHPGESEPLSQMVISDLQHSSGPILLAIGPEGGYLDREVCELKSIGFKAANLGKRILKVETAVVASMTLVRLFSLL